MELTALFLQIRSWRLHGLLDGELRRDVGSVSLCLSIPPLHNLLTDFSNSSALALESLITLLTVRGIPFFMLLWIIGTSLSMAISTAIA
jgi:hypothetical protein